MKCERALTILKSVKEKEDIKLNKKELTELIQFGLISKFTTKESEKDIQSKLSNFKQEFFKLSEGIRDLNKSIISNEGDFSQLSIFSRMLSYLFIGSGAKLRKQLSNLKKEIEPKEVELAEIKNQIIKLTVSQETIDRTVKVNGEIIYLTPLGETILYEINARKRYLSRDLKDLLNVTQQLDKEFSNLLSRMESFMKGRKFPPVWGMFLLNMDLTALTSIYNKAMRAYYYYYINPYKKMMTKTLQSLLPAGTSIPRSVRLNPTDEISSLFIRYGGYFYKSKNVIPLIGKTFAVWAKRQETTKTRSTSTPKVIEDYLENLTMLLKRQSRSRGSKSPIGNLDSLFDEETFYSMIVLAFAKNPEDFEYFYDQLNDVPEGRKFFSAIASLFPWDPEETWMVLRRAQSIVLRAESAKFIPELIEYAILLSINPTIISIENNVTEEQADKWRCLIIPIIHIITYSFLEKKLEKYVKRRPLSYVTSPRTPRYRRHSYLHYHYVG